MRLMRRVSLRAVLGWSVALTALITVLHVITSRNLTSTQEDFSTTTTSKDGITVKKKTYVGNTGSFKFYRLKARNYTIDAETAKLCTDTHLTQCNPPTRRPSSLRELDRQKRKPYLFAMLRSPDFMDRDPSFEGCDYDNCKFVGTGPQYAKGADALFVYVVRMGDNEFPPPTGRTPNQVYFLGTWETPSNSLAGVFENANSPWKNAFNATITYRIDSDMHYGYGLLDFQPKAPNMLPNYRAVFRDKTKTAVWIVSNCKSTAKRQEYVQEMQKYIDIDIYGSCGMPCELFDEICVPEFVRTYKFYLSFENSYCTDYITEKFFKLYVDGSHIVPVTRGAVDYNKEFPAKSLVNAADFKGPRELALFLKALGENEEEYAHYLKVKDMYRGITYGNRFCQMCEYMHKNDGKTRILPDANKWYRDGQCWAPKDI